MTLPILVAATAAAWAGSILWVDHQREPGDEGAGGGGIKLVGCASTPGGLASGLLAWMSLVAVTGRRRWR